MGDNKKVANSVVALSSAAVVAIYGAGYARTSAAADRFAQQAAERRPRVPAPRGERDVAALNVGAPVPAAAPIAAPAATAVENAPSQPASSPVALTEPKAETPAAPPRDPEPIKAVAKLKPAADTPTTFTAAGNAAAEGEGPATATGMAATAAAPTAATRPAAEPVAPPPAAPAPTPAPAPAADTAKGLYKDGTYLGWGTSRHGDIQAAVTIESGRITVARVERCETRYSCSWITPIPPRILIKQGTTYDYVSGATESSDAFQDAVSEALSQAK